MSSRFNVLIDYTIFSRCFIVFQFFYTIKNFFSGYITVYIHNGTFPMNIDVTRFFGNK